MNAHTFNMHSASNVPATQRTVADLVAEYEERFNNLPEALAAFNQAFDDINMAVTVQGTFAESICTRPYLHESRLAKNLLISGWKAIYSRLQIDRIATAKDKKLFERTLSDPPPLTFDNAKATFGHYLMAPRHHILRGLAEVFCELDQAYKSHSKVKIGVAGLPKRVIVEYVGGWGSYGYDKIKDVLNALAAYRGQPVVDHSEMQPLDRLVFCGDHKAGVIDIRGVTIKKFKNGNAHIMFDAGTCQDINMALAEFYGDVLPDVEPENVKPSASTAVAKDLQFYWSPKAVVDEAIMYAGIYRKGEYASGHEPPAHRVLEPSCGDGRILDELKARGCNSLGIEYHPGRAAECRAKGHSVLVGNFLEQPPTPEFDYVIMNPPFYGRHYVKHVQHALKFLKPGGVLVSILPATAHYDHGELKGEWKDLPVGSFNEAGTNVPTGLLRIRKAFS